MATTTKRSKPTVVVHTLRLNGEALGTLVMNLGDDGTYATTVQLTSARVHLKPRARTASLRAARSELDAVLEAITIDKLALGDKATETQQPDQQVLAPASPLAR